jgi:hypothetical protein
MLPENEAHTGVEFMKTRGFTISVTLGLLAAISVVLWRITRGVGTPTEALLLSVILTIMSVLASWVVSNYYANYSYDENLRVFALKAAEKVTNLSNELARLSVFLQQELDSDDYDSPREELLHRDARIEAAIHIINTLKSVNDRSLSDWQGVIGEEISAQREVQEEREEHLRDLLERVQSLPRERVENEQEPHDEAGLNLLPELESIKKDLRVLATQVSGIPLRSISSKPQRQNLQKTCPVCSAPVSYRQRPSPGGTKSANCKHCGAKLFSQFSDGEFTLHLRAPQQTTLACPACGQQVSVGVDPVMGSFQITECPMCAGGLGITRTRSGLSVKVVDADGKQNGPSAEKRPITEAFLQKVAQAMPPQPWPPGAAKACARQLGITQSTMSEALTELIKRGVFKTQINGVLYVPVPNTEAVPR